jgi:hypothetical protein
VVSAIQRIPYAQPEKVNSLPEEAKSMLSYVRTKLPAQMYKALENEVVALSEGSEKPVLSEKTSYGGALSFANTSYYSSIGAYNPDQIPMHIYEKMSNDPTIALGLGVIKYTPAGLNWRIESSNKIQRKFITKALKNIYRPTILSLTDAVRLGLAVGEKVWEVKEVDLYDDSGKGKRKIFSDDMYVLEKIKFINPDTVRIRVDDKGNFLGITQSNTYNFSSGSSFYTNVNKNKVVLYSYNMKFGNYFGESRLKNCYPAWYWSMVLTQFMLKYYERRGQPLTLVRAPRGSSTDVNGNKVDNLAHALKIGQGAISNSIVALPSDFDKNNGKELWSLEVVKDDQRGEMFIDILNYMDSRKLRGLFIPDKLGLASDGSAHSASGSSAGDTLDVFMMMEQALINDIEYVFDNQIIPDLLKYNFPKDQIEEACLKIEKLDYNRKLLMKDVFLRMIMLVGSNVREGKEPNLLPSIKKLAEMLDLPLETYSEMFKDIPIAEVDPLNPTNVNGKSDENVQNSPTPTLKKKAMQDANNQNRSTSRKERSTKERSTREKR